MDRKILFILMGLILLPSLAGAVELYRDGDASLSVGYWGQAWYQYVDPDDSEELNDFMIRRTYFSVKGTATPKLSFFMHYAGDRIGQEGLDNSGFGLGTGLALRDAWVNYKVLGNDFMIQAGRMYIPFTRNYGTTSTKALLTTELDWGQGGIRSGIFYPSKVGRDDSVTLWGNVLEDKLQYRLMAGEGVEDFTADDPETADINEANGNPDDNLRFAGRLSFNFFDTETGWFNKGTNLGQKKILAIGGGVDYQEDLVWGDKQDDYTAYTADIHLDMPMGAGAVTADAAYIGVENTVNGITSSDLTAGTDGDIITGQLGFLFNRNIQPFVHAEVIMPDANGAEDTNVYGAGANYYIKGPANKVTAEYTRVDSDNAEIGETDIITVQAAFGF
ncbi:MAG: porin [Thermodesulfobacteriota bacterium]